MNNNNCFDNLDCLQQFNLSKQFFYGSFSFRFIQLFISTKQKYFISLLFFLISTIQLTSCQKESLIKKRLSFKASSLACLPR